MPAMKLHTVQIALGANLGNCLQTLQAALEMLRAHPKINLLRIAGFQQTAPVGGPANQPPYLNSAATLETSLSPAELLRELNKIETALGRDRAKEERFGPRTCDLDILLFDEQKIDTPELTIPHPRMHERQFVLCPLSEIAPDAIHCTTGKTIAQLLADLEAQK